MKILLLGSAPNQLIERVAGHFLLDPQKKLKKELDLVIREDRKSYFLEKEIFANIYGLTDDVFNLATGHAIELANRLKEKTYHFIVVIRPEMKNDPAYDNVIAFAQALSSRRLVIMDRNLEAHAVKRIKKSAPMKRSLALIGMNPQRTRYPSVSGSGKVPILWNTSTGC
jgi:hypothetical protein